MSYKERKFCKVCLKDTLHEDGQCVPCLQTKHTELPISIDTHYTSPTGSIRKNSGKPEMSQLDPRFIIDLADLITKSAAKYGKFNYTKGQNYSVAFDSCMRHLLKFQQGQDFDDESSSSHILHAAANLMILYCSFLRHKELDDRCEEFKNKSN